MRPYIMEVVGTFFLTIAVSFTGNPVAIGLMLASMIYIGGHVSGGHYNPAISLAAWMRGVLKTDVMFIYMGAQTIGAVAALWLYQSVTGQAFKLDVSPEAPLWISVLVEAMLAGVLCLTFLTVATTRRFKEHMIYGIAVGLALMSIAFIGGVFNPSIAFAAMLSGRMGAANAASVIASTNAILIYLGGPLLGGILAAFAFKYFNPKE